MNNTEIEGLAHSEKSININGLWENVRRDCYFDDITENKEDITLIWLDEQIDNSIEFLEILEKLRELNDYILLYTNPQLCIYDQAVHQYVEKSCRLSSIGDCYFHRTERAFFSSRSLIKYFATTYIMVIFSTM